MTSLFKCKISHIFVVKGLRGNCILCQLFNKKQNTIYVEQRLFTQWCFLCLWHTVDCLVVCRPPPSLTLPHDMLEECTAVAFGIQEIYKC